jgi:hypothetical protein
MVICCWAISANHSLAAPYSLCHFLEAYCTLLAM